MRPFVVLTAAALAVGAAAHGSGLEDGNGNNGAMVSAAADKTSVFTFPVPQETQTSTGSATTPPESTLKSAAPSVVESTTKAEKNPSESRNVNGSAPPLPTDNNAIYGPVNGETTTAAIITTTSQTSSSAPPGITTSPDSSTGEPTTLTTIRRVSTIQVTVDPSTTPTQRPGDDGSDDDDGDDDGHGGRYPKPTRTRSSHDDAPFPIPSDIIEEILKELNGTKGIDGEDIQRWLDEMRERLGGEGTER